MPRSARLPILLSFAATAIGQTPPPPTAIDGELDRISAKVTRILASDDHHVLLAVEVRNRSDRSFEPLRFRLGTGRGDEPWPHTIDRAPWPKTARIGRPVPPRGKAVYSLFVGNAGLSKRPMVEVVLGSFWSPDTIDEQIAACPVELGALRHEVVRGETGSMPRTLVPLKNTSQRPVDVILRGRASAPRDGEFLWTASLGPGQTRTLAVEHLPWALSWNTESWGNGARIDALEAVDWTWRMPRDSAAAAARLLDAYRSWHRWDGGVSATGQFTIDSLPVGGGARARGAGRFEIDAHGKVRIDLVSGDNRELGAERAISSAFRDLFRPSVDVVAATNTFDDMGDDFVANRGERWNDDRTYASRSTDDPDAQWPIWRVVDGRIVASGHATESVRYTWETATLGSGWVCTARYGRNAWPRYTWRWQLVDGVAVPKRFEEIWAIDAKGAMTKGKLIQFDDVAIHGTAAVASEPAAPSGPGAESLRTAWDASFRYPLDPVTLRCTFRIESPGNDGVWAGQKFVTGSMRLTDFRGFTHGDMWSTIDLDLDPALPRSAGPALRSAIPDRLGLWRGRDLAGRPAFDTAFAGATIGPARGGRFAIEGGSYSAVRVEDGRVTEIETASGIRRRTTYGRVGDAHVPIRVVTGDEVLTAQWEDFDGYLLPTRFRFEHVFGPDWGPETIQLTDVRIQR